MTENPQPEENLTEEFRQLGRNLISALQTAWESPERKRLQQEVISGLNELGDTLRKEADVLSSSETAKKFKTNVEQIGEQIRSSEPQTKIRQELLGALRTANLELQKVIERWSEDQAASSEATPPMEDEESQPQKDNE